MLSLLSMCLDHVALYCANNKIASLAGVHHELCEKVFNIMKRDHVISSSSLLLFSGCGFQSISLRCSQTQPVHRLFMYENHLSFNNYTTFSPPLTDPMDDLTCTTLTTITDRHLATLYKFPDLVRLDLTNCFHIESLQGLAGLTQLVSLSMSNCILVQDSEMAHLKGLSNLLELRLDGVKISETGISTLTTLTQLKQLYLHNNSLLSSKTVHIIATHFPCLRSLSFGYSSEMTPENVTQLFTMTKLVALDLRNFPHVRSKFGEKQTALNSAMREMRHLKYLNMSISGVYISDESLWKGLDISGLDALDLEVIVSHDIFALEPVLSSSSELNKTMNAVALKYCHIAPSTLSFTCLANLSFLDITHSDINDIGFEAVAKLAGLVFLDISYCTSLSEDSLLLLSRLTNLRHLNLTSTQCSDTTVAAFTMQLLNLVELFLDFTKVSMRNYFLPDSLLTLSLTGCASFDEEGVINLRNLSRLQNLEFHYCAPLTAHGLASLARLHSLKVLYLPVPIDSNIVHNVLNHFTGLISLRWYDSVHITNETTLNLMNFTNLKDLSLPECHRWNAINTLAPSIVNLFLSGCSLKDTDFINISSFKLLLILDISGNTNISDYGLSLVATATSLTSLNLSGLRKITHKGVGQLTQLTKLQVLSTFQCSLVDHEEDRLAFLLDEKRVTKLVLENGHDKVRAYQFVQLRSMLNAFSKLVKHRCTGMQIEYATKVEALRRTVNNKVAMLDQIRCAMKPPEIWLMMHLWDKKELAGDHTIAEEYVMSCLAIHADKRFEDVKEMLGLSWKEFTSEHRAGVQTMVEMFGEMGSKKREAQRSSLLHLISKSRSTSSQIGNDDDEDDSRNSSRLYPPSIT